jgi:hypothetical protein
MTNLTRPLVIVVGCALLSTPARAQIEPNFDSLSGVVKPGDRVSLEDPTGRKQWATVRAFAGTRLQVDIDGAARDFQPSMVRRIRIKRQDPLWNGALIGAGIGALLGGAVVASVGAETPPSGAAGILFTAGMFAPIGLLIDYSINKRVVIYGPPKPRYTLPRQEFGSNSP